MAALIVDARLYARRTQEETCALLGWDLSHLEDLETAVIPPSLPELEALAAIYAVPVDHFFGSTSLSDGMPKLRVETMRQRLELRNRILGAMIMQARTRRNFSRDDLSMSTNLTIEEITDYELGQVPIPVTDLEDITHILQIDVFDWIDSYAIPTRDITFKPFKIADLQPQKVMAAVDEPAVPAPQAVPAAVTEAKPETVPSQLPSVQEASVSSAMPPTQKAEEPAPSIPPQQPTREPVELDLSAENLPSELADFISNPVNRQYLLLANNLSRMPADQLRRIAESLLEITF